MAKWNKPGGGGGATSVNTGIVDINPVYGSDPTGAGVRGESNMGPGVLGRSIRTNNPQAMPGSGESDGVQGESIRNGVHGVSHSATDSGVWGENKGGGYGVSGATSSDFQADTNGTAGIWGHNYGTGTGIKGTSAGGDGVLAYSWSNAHAGVSASNNSGGFGVWASGSPAGHFEGDVHVTGDLILINSPASGDVAEDFDLEDDPVHAEPGTVLIINSSGKLCTSADPYDTRVAGVVSGAGDFRPAVVLQRIKAAGRRSPIALIGKTFCKVDASFGSVTAGDLLTTSPTRGHAMKANDRSRALGAILGKALTSLESGCGLIPILVSLR